VGPFNGRSVVVVGRKALKLRSPCFSATVPTSLSTRAFRRGQIFSLLGLPGRGLLRLTCGEIAGGRAFCLAKTAWRGEITLLYDRCGQPLDGWGVEV